MIDMYSEHDKQLEQQVDRALKALPDLAAPSTLAPRVMAILAARRELPWYRRSWEFWPPAVKALSLAIMIGGFGALCFAAWQLTQAAGYTVALEELGQRFAWLVTAWKTVLVLASAIAVVVKQLGTPFIAACCLALGVGYAICVGLGTICVRLAMARTY